MGLSLPSTRFGVRDGGLRAAAAVADGPGLRARALGPDLQGAHLIDPGDAAAARADLHRVDDGEHHGMAARVPAYVVAVAELGLAVLDEVGLGSGAAHIEGDDVSVP